MSNEEGQVGQRSVVGQCNDEKYMRGALTMARRNLGQTGCNPSVGAVLIKYDGGPSPQIIARAVTGIGGTPHAEPQAIASAGAAAKDATLYVTLEPCNHHGRTPPCTEAIINAGIKRVVIAGADPDDRVAGEGIARLEAANISVTTGVLQKQADLLNAGHINRQTKSRPFIILKTAVSADGLIEEGGKEGPAWVTSSLARQRGHLLRAEVDAILIGRKTAKIDNPSLTCRIKGMELRSPQIIVIDTNLQLPEDLTLFNSGKIPLIICSDKIPETDIDAYMARGTNIISVATNSQGQIDLTALTTALADNGVTRLLIEGGPTLAGSFLEAKLIDQLNVFIGSSKASNSARPPFGQHNLQWPMEKLGFELDHELPLSDNLMRQYHLPKSPTLS